MDEDDDFSDVLEPSPQIEEEPDEVEKDDLVTAEKFQPVPESDGMKLITGASPVVVSREEAAIVEKGLSTETEVVTVESKEEETIVKEGVSMGYVEEKNTETELPVGDSEETIAELEFQIVELEMDKETEVLVAKPEDEEPFGEEGLPMVYTEMNVETEVGDRVTETEVEEMRTVTEVEDMHSGAEMGEKDTETEVGENLEMDTETQEDMEMEVTKADLETEEVEMEMEVAGAEIDTEVPEAEAELYTEVAEEAEIDADAAEQETEAKVAEEETEADADVAEEETEADADVAEAETVADVAEEDTEAEVAEEDTEADVAEEETEVDVAETETEVMELGRAGDGKRKRGRNSRAPMRVPQRKKIEEDVCFICFDGGELVLCDRRGCPKAYHPSCVNRDEAFFRAKGRWNCGWHICSICEKNAYYMCYTCTYSLCKGCIKDAVIFCVRGNKGFCEACMRTVLMIERNEQGSQEMGQVDFDDKNSWEYLFKDYWTDLKGKLCITSDELAQAKNPWKASDVPSRKQELPYDLHDATNDAGSDSDRFENPKANKPKRRRGKRLSKSSPKEAGLPAVAIAEEAAVPVATEWASKELLEFVMHMKNGDGSVLSQFDVQALLLEYIKRNKLRDPRRKSQIICDSRLENLFGKARVGHFEMLKLLESHFLIKEDSQADYLQRSVVDTEASQLEVDGNADVLIKGGKDRKRKMRKKDDRRPQSNLDDYAAIDMHNINLIYLRRSLMEDLIGDAEKFHDQVVGSFVRIRISGSVQKQDIYRLVQVAGTSKAAEPYKVGKRTTYFMLEISNLNKIEVISIDIISNQDFTEDECKRLRQSIKCGLINRLTVGDVLEKAMALHAVRVNDWLETEIVRLSHLRDRASEKGRRKELRECVEKLQLLKTAGERQRRLEEIPVVHADPNMDPSHESEEDEEEDYKRQEVYMRPRGTGFGKRGREPISPGTGGSASNDSWSGTRKIFSKNWELNRNLSDKDILNRGDDAAAAKIMHETSQNHGKDRDKQQSNNGEKLTTATNSEASSWNGLATLAGLRSAEVTQPTTKINETDKVWHYRDPSGKVQGPFSMVQLRKWSNTGYFPVDLRIWTNTGKQDDLILVTDALAEYFPTEQPSVDGGLPKTQQTTNSGKPYGTTLPQGREVQGGERTKFDQNHEAGKLHTTVSSFAQSGGENLKPQQEITPSQAWAAPSLVVSRDRWDSDHGGIIDSMNLPSPTPTQNASGWTRGQASENKQPSNSFPVQPDGSNLGSSSFSAGNEVLTGQSGNLTDQSSPTSLINPVVGVDGPSVSHPSLSQQSIIPRNKEPNMVDSVLPTLSNTGGLSMQGSRVDTSSFVFSSLIPMSGNGVFLSSTNVVQSASQSSVPNESHGVQAHVHPDRAADLAGGLMDPASDAKNARVDPLNPVQLITSQNPSVDARGWGPGLASIPMPMQQPAYGQWAPSPSSVNSPSFNAVNPAGSFSTPSLPPSNPWRPPVPGNQLETGPNIRSPAPQNLPWSMGVSENHSTAPNLRPENPTPNWGPMSGNQNMGWGGPAPTNANMNWGGQGLAAGGTNPGPAPVVANMNWGPALQGLAPGNTAPEPAHANTNMNWGAVGQVPPAGNANPGPALGSTNMNWGAAGQGPVPGNANPGFVAPTGNLGMWGSDQNRNGDRFTGQRDRSFQAGNGGYGAGRPWNRQSSFSGGGAGVSRPPLSGHRDRDQVCRFHENGHCKKGASCNYLHS